ncbi:MAG TPA: carboxypeptidase regulatory-like domain-containing protein [Acidobacteriaceae bacterium]|jgi:plastocyanin
MNALRTFFAIGILASSAAAQNITGTITIDRKLTKPSVTASIPIYQRGVVVKLGKDATPDPLAFERSRVVVFLEGAAASPASAEHAGPFVMQQVNREFSPEVLVVPAGAAVNFPNMDPVFHNIFSLSKPKMFDLGSYDQGESRRVVFPKPGVVSVYCHLHPNMAATIIVTPNRWYAKPDASGNYKMENVPPGHYTVVAWHRATGFLRKPVVVEAGHDLDVSFTLPLTEDQQKPAGMQATPARLAGSR